VAVVVQLTLQLVPTAAQVAAVLLTPLAARVRQIKVMQVD
jgi:hypothetical protein